MHPFVTTLQNIGQLSCQPESKIFEQMPDMVTAFRLDVNKNQNNQWPVPRWHPICHTSLRVSYTEDRTKKADNYRWKSGQVNRESWCRWRNGPCLVHRPLNIINGTSCDYYFWSVNWLCLQLCNRWWFWKMPERILLVNESDECKSFHCSSNNFIRFGWSSGKIF